MYFIIQATSAGVNPIDRGGIGKEGGLPQTNAADMEYTMLERGDGTDTRGTTVSMHILFNQAGALCTRYNNRVTGTQVQQNFVQRLVSSVGGFAFLLISFMASIFPRHFWENASHDQSAILGCAPISCYRKETSPNGFASSLQMARTYATHTSSSTSTCNNFTSFLYDIQANQASSNLDSRLVARQGFRVSTSTKSGLELAEGDPSQLHESLYSRQGTQNLAAASQVC